MSFEPGPVFAQWRKFRKCPLRRRFMGTSIFVAGKSCSDKGQREGNVFSQQHLRLDSKAGLHRRALSKGCASERQSLTEYWINVPIHHMQGNPRLLKSLPQQIQCTRMALCRICCSPTPLKWGKIQITFQIRAAPAHVGSRYLDLAHGFLKRCGPEKHRSDLRTLPVPK